MHLPQRMLILGCLTMAAAGGCRLFGKDPATNSYESAKRELARDAAGKNHRQVSYEAPVLDGPEEKPFGLNDLAPANISSTMKKAVGQGPNRQVAKDLYAEGDALFREASALTGDERTEKFVEAADKFKAAAERWPNSAIEEDALFMRGESRFFADHYSQARDAYDLLMKKHPNTRHLDTVDNRRYALAQYWIELHRQDPHWTLTPNYFDPRRPRNDTFGHAIKVFDRIRLDDPTGQLADDATMAAGNGHFAAGSYDRADHFYTDLRKTFPDSPHQFEAHFLSVKCKLKLYQGPDYDDKPLVDAEDLVRRIYKLFPEQAEAHREYLENAYKEIRLKKGAKNWAMAQYYENRSEYGGARHYYEMLARDFTDTSYADEARERLAEIRDYPDVPPDRFKWLTQYFPTGRKKSQPLWANSQLNWKAR